MEENLKPTNEIEDEIIERTRNMSTEEIKEHLKKQIRLCGRMRIPITVWWVISFSLIGYGVFQNELWTSLAGLLFNVVLFVAYVAYMGTSITDIVDLADVLEKRNEL